MVNQEITITISNKRDLAVLYVPFMSIVTLKCVNFTFTFLQMGYLLLSVLIKKTLDPLPNLSNNVKISPLQKKLTDFSYLLFTPL